MAPTYVLAYNPGPSPVNVDAAGRSIGGGEWAPARRSDLLNGLANSGAVIMVTTLDEEGAGDEALAAWHQVGEWNASAERWAAVDLPTVRDAAVAHVKAGTIHLAPGARQRFSDTIAASHAADDTRDAEGDVADADRVELVDLLVRASIPVPAARAKRTSPEE